MSDDPNVKNPRKTRGRPFQPGNSGRPKGARNRRTVLAERVLAADLTAVCEAVNRAALQGDMQAARIVLDRLVPLRKGRPVAFTSPSELTAAGLTEAFKHVIDATAGGQLTPEEGATVATLFEAARRVIETEQIEARLRQVEEQLQGDRR